MDCKKCHNAGSTNFSPPITFTCLDYTCQEYGHKIQIDWTGQESKINDSQAVQALEENKQMDYTCGNCLAKAWANYDDTAKQCCNTQCSQFGLWIPTGKVAKKEYSDEASIFLDSKPNEKRSEEIETVTLQIPWENLPGFSWSSSYSDAEDIKQKVSEAILFEGTGWYPSMTLGCEEISLIVENNGKLDFYHFEFDPRKFKILVEIPFLGYPQK